MEKLSLNYHQISVTSKSYYDNYNYNIFLIFAQNIDCGYSLLLVPTIYV